MRFNFFFGKNIFTLAKTSSLTNSFSLSSVEVFPDAFSNNRNFCLAKSLFCRDNAAEMNEKMRE